jgi:hypothetical protein
VELLGNYVARSGIEVLSMKKLQRCALRFALDFVRFEVFTAVTMKNGVFWDVTPCGSCNNRRFRAA